MTAMGQDAMHRVVSAGFGDGFVDAVRDAFGAAPPWAYVALAAVFVLAALFGLLFLAMLGALPENLETEALADEDIDDGELWELVAAYERIGFERIGPAARLSGIAPHLVVVPLLQQDGACFGTVYRAATKPRRLGCDVVSLLDVDVSALTTAMDKMAGAAPDCPGGLRQIFAGASPQELLARHVEALCHLEAAGLRVRKVTAADFAPALCLSFALQRHLLLRAPLGSVARALWRVVTGRSPYLGPIAEQALAAEQIRALRDGQWPDAAAKSRLAGV